MDWFRFYSETIRDSKIRRVARKTGETPAHVIGVWSILLSIASESQQRGVLLLGNDPVTVDDIEDVTGCNVSATLREMVQVGMLSLDGEVYSIAAWDKRQYSSDNSTPRVQKHRQGKKQAETLHETLPQRFGNAPETDADAETETDVAPQSPELRDVERMFVGNLINAVSERDPGQRFHNGFSLAPASRDLLIQAIQGNAAITAKSIDWALDQWEAAKPKERFNPAQTGCVNWMLTTIVNSYRRNGRPKYVNGESHDADTRPRVPAPSKEDQAAADARQAEYERQIAEQLARAGKL